MKYALPLISQLPRLCPAVGHYCFIAENACTMLQPLAVDNVQNSHRKLYNWVQPKDLSYRGLHESGCTSGCTEPPPIAVPGGVLCG